MTEQPQRFFEFDNFLLDTQQRLLLRDGEPMDLTPKVFDILLELVEGGGRVVEKKELMESVWPDSFVEESNLTQHISTLRKKLGHDSGKQRYILTVPGRGYRFVAPVKSWDDDAIVTVREQVRSRVTIRDSAGRDSAGAPTEPAIELERSPQLLLPTSTAISPLRKYRVLLVIASLAILGGIAILFVSRARRSVSAPFTHTKLIRFTTDGKVVCAAISPNGKHVAYAVADGVQQSLWIRQVATSNTGVPVIGPSDFGYLGLTFSPDNDYIYYVAAPVNSPSALYRVPALGGKAVRLVEDVDSPPAFSPDGKRIAYLRGYPDTHESALMAANIDGVGESRLSAVKAPASQLNFGQGPSWSPDGETIACSVSVTDESGQHQEIYTASARGGELKPLTQSKWLRVARAAWTRDGRGLLITAADPETTVSQVWYVPYPAGDPRKITNDLNDYKGLTMTSDSQLSAVVQSDQQSNVWVAPVEDGKGATQITSTNYDGYDGLTWIPDGRLLYTATRNGAQDLWLTDQQGKQKTQLTESAGNNFAPAISPDGHTIVFVSTRDGNTHLWRMDPDGTHIQRLTNGSRDSSPVFSGDGQWILYRSGVSGSPGIFKVALSGGSPVRLTEHIVGAPAISPDGKTIAFTNRLTALGETKIGVLALDGSARLRILNSTDVPRRLLLRWTKDGQAIAYIKTGGGISNIWLQPLADGPAKQLTNFDSGLIFNFAISLDGRLALSRGHESSDVVLISWEN